MISNVLQFFEIGHIATRAAKIGKIVKENQPKQFWGNTASPNVQRHCAKIFNLQRWKV